MVEETSQRRASIELETSTEDLRLKEMLTVIESNPSVEHKIFFDQSCSING